jgi:hypothetical protein
MIYYNGDTNKYEDLILTDNDLSVKEVVEQMYEEKPTLFIVDLSNRTQEYYENVVGTADNRLYAVIDYYCEMLITEKYREWYTKGSKTLDNSGKEVI